MDCTDRTVPGPNGGTVPVLTPISPSFVRNALLDLLILCCSRVGKREREREGGKCRGTRSGGRERGGGGGGRGEGGWGGDGGVYEDVRDGDSSQSKKRRSADHDSEGGRDRDSDRVRVREKDTRSTGGHSQDPVRPFSPPRVCFRVVLSRLLDFIARKRGYDNSSLLLLDHSRWLLSQWIRPPGADIENSDSQTDQNTQSQSSRNRNNGQTKNKNIRLEDFPYKILDPNSRSFSDFLHNFSSILFPLICSVEDSRERWRLMLGNCVCVCVGVRVRVCVCVGMCWWVYVYVCVGVGVGVGVGVCVCVGGCLCVCMCAWVYVCVCVWSC